MESIVAARVDPGWFATNVQGMAPTSALSTTNLADPEVTERLLANYGAFVRFVALRVGARDVAEDIVQETLARNLERLAALRDREAALPWFYQALRNATADYFRRDARVERMEAQLVHESQSAEPTPESVLARACCCATRAASELKPEYAQALQRIEVEGASLKGFAAEQGISAMNAGVRVHRARAALRHELEACCGTSAAHGCPSCGCEAAPKADRRPA